MLETKQSKSVLFMGLAAFFLLAIETGALVATLPQGTVLGQIVYDEDYGYGYNDGSTNSNSNNNNTAYAGDSYGYGYNETPLAAVKPTSLGTNTALKTKVDTKVPSKVAPSVVTKIEVLPYLKVLNKKVATKVGVYVYDQYGKRVSVKVVWSAKGGKMTVINNDLAVYKAGLVRGKYTIRASYRTAAGRTVAGSAMVEIR